MTKAFDMIAAGLEDAIAFANGDTTRGRLTKPTDVAAVRAQTRKTQEQFANAYHLPIGTVRDWEQRRRQPDAPARVLLALIAAAPEQVEAMLKQAEAA